MSNELMMSGMKQEREYEFSRVLEGDAESLHARLAEAAERLGFQVLSEQPFVARRRATGAGRSGCSADILEYPAELVVALKPLSDAATHATFSYTVKNYHYRMQGDERTLECETQALAALAYAQGTPTACSSCGAEASDDSRFCRRCGAPLVSEEPAEVELLRLSAGARAAAKSIRMGVVGIIASLVVAVVLIWAGRGRAEEWARLILSIGGITGLFILVSGLWRLYRTLNSGREEKTLPPSAETWRAVGAARTSALPPASAQASVTENTTELLEKEKIRG